MAPSRVILYSSPSQLRFQPYLFPMPLLIVSEVNGGPSLPAFPFLHQEPEPPTDQAWSPE